MVVRLCGRQLVYRLCHGTVAPSPIKHLLTSAIVCRRWAFLGPSSCAPSTGFGATPCQRVAGSLARCPIGRFWPCPPAQPCGQFAFYTTAPRIAYREYRGGVLTQGVCVRGGFFVKLPGHIPGPTLVVLYCFVCLREVTIFGFGSVDLFCGKPCLIDYPTCIFDVPSAGVLPKHPQH